MYDGMIGEIRLFSGNFAPDGWMFCNGESLSIGQYHALFSILGNRYGGNATTDFQLPRLSPLKESDGGETPIRYVICLIGMYPRRP